MWCDKVDGDNHGLLLNQKFETWNNIFKHKVKILKLKTW
jgi:hypothetical protein